MDAHVLMGEWRRFREDKLILAMNVIYIYWILHSEGRYKQAAVGAH